MQRLMEYISDLKTVLDKLPVEHIQQVVTLLHEARQNGRRIFVLGNGECAASAVQMACDLIKNTRQAGWPGFKVVNLAENLALYSAFASEDGPEAVFAQQLENQVERGDIVIGFSLTGNNLSVIRAVDAANRRAATTVCFTGQTAGRLGASADVCIAVPSDAPEQIQDLQLIAGHMIIKSLREDAQQVKAASQLERLFPETGVQAQPRKSREPELQPDYDSRLSERSRNSLDLLASLSREMALELELGELLRRVLGLTLYNLKATSGSIVVLNEKGQVVEGAIAYNGDIRKSASDQAREILDHGLAGWVVQNRKAALIYNTRDDPRWLPRSWDREGKSRSAVSVPLMENDKVLGVLTLVNSQGARFTEEDLTLLATIAVFISLINYPV